MHTYSKTIVLSGDNRVGSFYTIEHITNISIESVVIPLTQYNVSGSNGTFKVNGTTITFPSRNYNHDTFLEMLKLLLEDHGITFTSSHEDKIVFKSSSEFTLSFEEGDLGSFIGFTEGRYTSTSDASDHTLTSTSRFHIYNTKFILVKISELSDEILMCSAVKASDLGKRLIRYNPKPPKNQMHFQPVTLNKLTFKIEDELGNEYQTNGLDSVITLRFTVKTKA